MKLSPRALLLLQLVADKTQVVKSGSREIRLFFFPNEQKMWSETLKDFIPVGGAADAAILRGLEKNGLIEPANKNLRYSFYITAAGRTALEGKK